MSTIVTIWLRADPDRFEQLAAENEAKLQEIRDRAVEAGVIAHRFYGSPGQIMVIDEWPDAERFQGFFASVQDDIAPLFEQLGVTDEPGITFWRKLDSRDEVGWES
jgi:quinol monooxygenase YgiN